MDTDRLNQIDARMAELLGTIAQTGFDGSVDTEALSKLAELSDERIRLTQPPLELAA